MATRLDKFYQTLAEFFDLLSDILDDLYESEESPLNGDEVRGAMFLLELYGKANSLNDFLNAYDLWKDFYKKDPKSLSLDFKTLLGLKDGVESFLIPMRVYNKNPNGEVMNDEAVADIFTFLKALVLHAVIYEEESRVATPLPTDTTATPLTKRQQIPLSEVRKNFGFPLK